MRSYPVTVKGVTFELPRQHELKATRTGIQWRFRAVNESLHIDRQLVGKEGVRVNGATVYVMVSEEEQRDIQIAELRRRRDIALQEQRQVGEKLKIIEARLRELGVTLT